jgi:carbonyl reductase 1
MQPVAKPTTTATTTSKPNTMKLLFLVTGANKGIGREIVSQIFTHAPAESRVRVLLTSRNVEAGEEVMKQLRKEGKDVHTVQLDVASPESVNNMVQAVEMHTKDFGASGLASLVNNAGMAFKGDAFSAEMAYQTMQTNVWGTLATTYALIPSLKNFAASDDGKLFAPRIVFVASQAGRLKQVSAPLQEKFSSPNVTHEEIDKLLHSFIDDIKAGKHRANGWPNSMYGISKLGLIAHARVLARELMESRIMVHHCCPGYCQTDMSSWKGNKTAAEGADTPAYLATRQISLADARDNTGGFWFERHLIEW